MKQFLIKRVLFLIPVILGVSTLVFLFLHLIPGDPVEVMLGESARAVDKELLRHDLGLDRPVLEQYGEFLKGMVRADFGKSFFYRRPVTEVILERGGATVELAAAAMVVALLIAFPLGIFSALRQHSLVDYSSTTFSLLGISMPNFWLGPLLILFFSIRLDWCPVSGKGGIVSIVLPALTLGTALAAMLSRIIRSSLLEVIQEEYIKTARSKGMKEGKVILKHALRNALIPVITIVGLQMGALLSGAIITENVFAWPGLGTLLITAIQTRDYPLVQGCVLVISFGYIIINLLTDFIYALVDPRIKLTL